MKTLVIHPNDRSTDCLRPIYMENGLIREGFTVVTNGRIDINLLLQMAERVIMLGHGSPGGLFSVGQFPTWDGFVIGDEQAELLRGKQNIYIWCHASEFVERHNLQGFASGMFISEVGEANWYRIKTAQKVVDDSNHHFATLLGNNIEQPERVVDLYDTDNDVVRFNRARLRSYGVVNANEA